MTDELRDKIARLPVWARDYIKRLQYANEPMVEECARSRKQVAEMEAKVRRVSNTNAALMELLSKAGKAGLDWAATVVSVLEGYEVFKPGDKGE